MEEKKLVPKRRFKGHEGRWRKKKLDDIANYRRGSFPQPYGEDKWYDEINGMPFVQVVDVAKNLKLVNNTKQKISQLAQPKSVYVEKGKVLVTLQGSIGRVAITQYPSYVDRTLLIFESYKFQVDTYYFAYIIQLLFDIEKQKAPGGTIKTITKEALSEFIVKIPCYAEQQKIGEFFKVLDERIANQERKIAKVKALKSAYLTEMFPQKGEVVPRRRFRGFDNKWEMKKIKDIADYRHGKAHEQNVVEKGKYVIVNSRFVSTSGMKKKYSNLQIEALYKGEIAFVLSDIPNGRALAKTFLITQNNLYTLNQRILGITPKENTDSYFLKEMIDRNEYFLSFDDGSNQTNLSNQDFENFELRCPDLEEQQKIGEFFENLDDQITTEEKKLEKLKKMKEAYLEEMFV